MTEPIITISKNFAVIPFNEHTIYDMILQCL